MALRIAIPTRKVGLGHSWKSRWTHIRSKNNILKSSSYTIWMISHGKMGCFDGSCKSHLRVPLPAGPHSGGPAGCTQGPRRGAHHVINMLSNPAHSRRAPAAARRVLFRARLAPGTWSVPGRGRGGAIRDNSRQLQTTPDYDCLLLLLS